jgi:hypothetical protein
MDHIVLLLLLNVVGIVSHNPFISHSSFPSNPWVTPGVGAEQKDSNHCYHGKSGQHRVPLVQAHTNIYRSSVNQHVHGSIQIAVHGAEGILGCIGNCSTNHD